LPGKDWPIEVKTRIDSMKKKGMTETYDKRNKTALNGKDSHMKNQIAFGNTMVSIAKSCRTYIFKYMLPSYIHEDDLDSGMQMQDMWYAMRKLVLYGVDITEKITASVNRNTSITGNEVVILILFFSSLYNLYLSY